MNDVIWVNFLCSSLKKWRKENNYHQFHKFVENFERKDNTWLWLYVDLKHNSAASKKIICHAKVKAQNQYHDTIHFTSGCSSTVGIIPKNYKSCTPWIKSILTLKHNIDPGLVLFFSSSKSSVIPALREKARCDVDK